MKEDQGRLEKGPEETSGAGHSVAPLHHTSKEIGAVVHPCLPRRRDWDVRPKGMLIAKSRRERARTGLVVWPSRADQRVWPRSDTVWGVSRICTTRVVPLDGRCTRGNSTPLCLTYLPSWRICCTSRPGLSGSSCRNRNNLQYGLGLLAWSTRVRA